MDLNTRQTKLGFALDPGDIAERRNMLGLVVLRLHGLELGDGALFARELLLWVFNVTAHGTGGDLKKSYAELAAYPWGLCCSESRVRRVVRALRKHRVLRVDENRYQSDGQSANSYTLDWEGIRQLLGLWSRSGVPTEHPPVPTEHPPGPTEHPFKEETPLPVPSVNSGPEPEGRAGRDGKDFRGEENDLDAVREELLATIPALAAAGQIEIAALPPGSCARGVYGPLSCNEIWKPLGLVPWFRCQLAAPYPATGNTEADLLLVLAAALYVQNQPRASVSKPVGLLINLLSRKQWRKVVPFVTEARGLLDAAIAAHGPAPLGRITRGLVTMEKNP